MSLIDRIKENKQFIYLTSLGMGFWAFIIITTLIGFISIFYVEEAVKLMISDYGYIGIFLLVLIIELLVQPTGPDLIIILGLVATLNPWTVFIITVLASHLSFYIAYRIGQRIGESGVKQITGTKSFEAITASTSKTGKWFMFFSAFTPIPYIPYLAGVWNLNFRDCMFYVIIPRTIRMFIVFVLTYYLGIKILELSLSTFI